MPPVFVRQIFYDEATRAALDPDFIPLDNTENARPDWFEFLPILNFLERNELDPGAWYGFVSPRFRDKTGCSGQLVQSLVEAVSSPTVGVFLFSPCWSQIAYFRNVFEQGEFFHAGLVSLSQAFFDHAKWPVRIDELVSHSGNAVFCNYLVAKPSFWRPWQKLARQLLDLCETGTGSLARALTNETLYGNAAGIYRMKVFLQERLASVILATTGQAAASLDFAKAHDPEYVLFDPSLQNREKLRACDRAKQKYCQTKNRTHLDEYYRLRAEVQTTFGGASSHTAVPAFGQSQ